MFGTPERAFLNFVVVVEVLFLFHAIVFGE